MKKFFALLIGTVLFLPGCAAEEQPEKDGKSGSTVAAKLDTTLRINIGSEPTTLDPAQAEDVTANRMLNGLFEGLVWMDEQCNPLPGVATSWEHNESSTVWTFHLRENAKWHDGSTVTANDFKYGIERTCTPSTLGNYANFVYGFLEGGKDYYTTGGLDKDLSLDSVKVIDDYTLELTTSIPTPFFLTMLAFPTWFPINKAVVDAHGNDWSTTPETYIGNGPFKLAEHHARDRIIVKKADTYWNKDEIFWDEVVFYMIDSENTEDQAFRGHELDVTDGVSVAQTQYWIKQPEFRSVASLWTYYVGFNTEEPPFDNKLVRKAFQTAINRQIIVDRITQSGELPGTGMVPTGMPSATPGIEYRAVAGSMVNDYDLDEARRLLKEAGYDENNPFPTVEYLYNTEDLHKKIGEQMQYTWKNAFDVDVRLQNTEWGVFLNRLSSGDFTFSRMNWIGDYADPLNFLELFTTGHPKNNPNFSNARYDELIELARNEGDPMIRQEHFIEAERILVVEEAAIAPVYFQRQTFLVQEDIEGCEANALGQMSYPRAHRIAK
jgi:oligopeptide transport system substrate-binding protein